jgi:O-antigen/teichoic acid export membrane protein
MFKNSRNLYWIVGGQVASLLGNFIVLKILTSGLSVGDYGYLVLWISIVLFFRQVIYDPISIIAAKKSIDIDFLGVPSLSGFQVIEFIAKRVFLAGAFLALLIAPIQYFSPDGYITFFMVTLGVVYLTANGPQGIYINIANVLNERKLAAKGVMADALIKLIAISLIFYVSSLDLVVVALLIALSSVLSNIYIKQVASKIHERISIEKKEFYRISKKLISLSAPLFPSTFLVAVKGVGDKVFMASFISIADLAAYNVLFQLGYVPMMLIIGIIQTYVSPDIYKQAAHKERIFKLVDDINNKVKRILLLSFVCLFVSYFVSDMIFLIFVGDQYFIYHEYLPYLVIAGALGGIGSILNTGIIAIYESEKSGKLIFGSVLLSILILASSISYFGFAGGIAGLILSSLVSVAIFYGSLNSNGVKSL